MISILTLKTSLRSTARKFGLTRFAAKALGALPGAAQYEECFGNAVVAAVRPGDHVWDIGANVGLYTARFSERAGATGSVCAFEPSPACCEAISARKLGDSVRVFNLALGDAPAWLKLHLSPDPLGTTHSLVCSAEDRGPAIDVRVATGDGMLEEYGLPVPNLIKLDVEGYEEDVLRGLDGILSTPACRAVFVEVHFGLLEQRGHLQAPARIEQSLRDRGFAVRWLDSSHIGALREQPKQS